jgi:subtilisin-like proprotein convertase family protein
MRRVLLGGAAAILLSMPVPALAVTYGGTGFSIPDGSFAGASSTITLSQGGLVQGMDLSLLGFNHTWVGDLTGTLTHAGVTVEWMQANGNNSSNLAGDYTIRDGAAVALNDAGGASITPGVYASESPFAAFDGTPWAGDWTLTIVDRADFDTGALNSWGLNLDPMGAGGAIPDGSFAGFSSTITLAAGNRVDDLDFTIFGLNHTWIGDLRGTLSHGGVTVSWLRGDSQNSQNLQGDYTFSDAGLVTLDLAGGNPRPSGLYRPFSPLDAFHGLDAAGDWVLKISDPADFDTGAFDGWNLSVNTYVPEPATWALMILGFAAAGAMLRQRKATAVAA